MRFWRRNQKSHLHLVQLFTLPLDLTQKIVGQSNFQPFQAKCLVQRVQMEPYSAIITQLVRHSPLVRKVLFQMRSQEDLVVRIKLIVQLISKKHHSIRMVFMKREHLDLSQMHRFTPKKLKILKEWTNLIIKVLCQSSKKMRPA